MAARGDPLIEWVKATRDLEFVDEFGASVVGLRKAIIERDQGEFNLRRAALLRSADRMERLLGSSNIFGWKPPGQPPEVLIPRPLVSTYLAEIVAEPAAVWPAQLEGLLADTLTRLRPRVEEKWRRSRWLAFFPLYWPLGVAGLAVDVLGQLLSASRLLPRTLVDRAVASPIGRVAQALVLTLELWTFWKLFVAGKLF